MKWPELSRVARRKPWSYLYLFISILLFILLVPLRPYGGVSWGSAIAAVCIFFLVWPFSAIMVFVSGEMAEVKSRIGLLGLGIVIAFVLPIMLSRPVWYFKEKIFFAMNQRKLESISKILYSIPAVKSKFNLLNGYTIDEIKLIDKGCSSSQKSVSLSSIEGDKQVSNILESLAEIDINDVYVDIHTVSFEFNRSFDDLMILLYSQCPQTNQNRAMSRGRLVTANWYCFE